MSVTLRDVAEHVGRSVTTVSRALADYSDVSPQTKEAVKIAVQELGYVPNITARQLQKQRTDTIGLLLPALNLRFSDPFFSEFLSAIVEQAKAAGFDLLVTTHTSADDEAETYLQYIRSRRVDGFILVRMARHDSRVKLLQEHNYPFVAFGRTEAPSDFPFVDEDSELGIRLIVDHLIALGHRRIGAIMEPAELSKSWFRMQGFINGLKANGIDYDQSLVREGGFRQRSGRLLGAQLLDMPDPPTAIVAGNDLIALGAMNAAHERGLVVGQDVSITGFDDIALAAYINPPLTTLHQPVHKIGTQICDMLIKLINRESLPQEQTVLSPELVVRESSGPPLDNPR